MNTRRAWIAVALACGALNAGAQSVRVTGSTTMRYVELRPFLRDSLPSDSTDGTALLRQMPDGRIVRCIPGDTYCYDTRPGGVISTVPVIHDLEMSAWGFGRGIRLSTQLRARQTWGGASYLWPQGEDAFDVLAAFAEIERERYSVRAGRQWKVSGLGFYNYDGVAVAIMPTGSTSLEVYGGGSLIRGLNEGRRGGALESIEGLSAPRPGLLFGAHVRYRATEQAVVSALYQVDFRDDREGVYSELAVVDASLTVGRTSVEGSVEADLTTAGVNEARLNARAPLFRRIAMFAEARSYRPYFELWTIWGAFSPVGYDEGRGGLTWADSAGRLMVRGEASYRRYDDVPGESLDEIKTNGWGTGTSVMWRPARDWRVDGAYRLEAGFGAARRDMSLGVHRQLGDRGSVAMQGMLFERLYEFRLDEGTVAGFGTEASYRVSDRFQLIASGSIYRHVGGGSAEGFDWNQRRGTVRVHWTLGAEPSIAVGAPR